MAKTKSTKPKVNFKEVMLKKGEYIGLGAALAAFAVLLLLGIMSWSDKADPTKISGDLSAKASGIDQKIRNPNDPTEPPPLPKWAEKGKKMEYLPVAVDEFPQTGPLFDPTGRPDSKRKNPVVLGIEESQPDLVRGAMRAYDIIDNPDGQTVAVQFTRKLESQDRDKLKKAFEKIKKGGKTLVRSRRNYDQMSGGGNGPMSPSSPSGPRPSGGPMGLRPPGGSMRPGMSGMPGRSGYNGGTERTETTIRYIPIEELEKEGSDSVPAQTVVPLRMFVVNCTIPLKRQLEEVKKAMRLESAEAARPYTHYDGFEVQRQISMILPNKELKVIQPWQKYNYEDKYIEKIHARKMSDYVELTDPNPANKVQGEFLPYFVRLDEALVTPLPELIPELGSYPPIRMQPILADIQKLKAAATPPTTTSDLMKRITKQNSRKDIFTATTAESSGAAGIYGKSQFNFSGPMNGKSPANGAAGGPAAGVFDNSTVDVDHLLLRFVDCDIQPGYAYEYKFQLRLLNPNYNYPAYVSNPADAREQVLLSPWIALEHPLQVSREDFLAPYDYHAYFTQTAETFKKQSYALRMLQVKAGQAVTQQVRWVDSIRMDGKQEPVGGWVAGAMPVDRGNYIGKKTYIKLPLWSSVQNEFVFRDHTGDSAKGKELPKECWPVDFSTQHVLVDFEGGKTVGRTEGGRSLPNEEVAFEMLILTEDGRLMVRRSDTPDKEGSGPVAMWRKWLEAVKNRPVVAPGSGPSNPFDRPMSK